MTNATIEFHPLRLAVLKEAESWIGTPFHHEARLKGHGVDCGQFLLAVYEAVGVMPHIETEHYPPDFHMHQSKEWYKGIVEQYADEIEDSPAPADLVLFRVGRVYSHGAIVVNWPLIIHAYVGHRKVERSFATGGELSQRKMKFFQPHAFAFAMPDVASTAEFMPDVASTAE
jgi:cell wall-associated NlpC family hydrolase